MRLSKCCSLLILAIFAGAFTGCMDITGRGPAPLAKTVGPATAAYPRVGHVYCMRGWLGIFSTGMDALADEIDHKTGVPAVSVADEEWRRLKGWLIEEREKGQIQEPLVLLGHSWGADDMIRVAEELKAQQISVDLLVLIDPVTPPPVPSNVKRVYCVYKSHPVSDVMPFWRGVSATVADAKTTPIQNIDLRTTNVGFDTTAIDHINIEKSADVHRMVMDQIKRVCPTRVAWLQQQHNATAQLTAPQPTGVSGKPAFAMP
jgi:pimeloyl-ACP methyl ester carboxylesterase